MSPLLLSDAPYWPGVEEFLKTILVCSVLAPFMVHELLVSPTETASDSHSVLGSFSNLRQDTLLSLRLHRDSNLRRGEPQNVP